jgi:hypothetical protein
MKALLIILTLVLGLCCAACIVLNIWIPDDRWNMTGGLFFAGALVSGFFASEARS